VSWRVLVKPQAEAEMACAFQWYEDQGSGLGAKFLEAADATIRNIAEGPERYAVIHGQVRCALMRRFPYSVYFHEEASLIVILTVAYQRRDPKVWQKGE
jgi:plasmid stabilization system protein ParE